MEEECKFQQPQVQVYGVETPVRALGTDSLIFLAQLCLCLGMGVEEHTVLGFYVHFFCFDFF